MTWFLVFDMYQVKYISADNMILIVNSCLLCLVYLSKKQLFINIFALFNWAKSNMSPPPPKKKKKKKKNKPKKLPNNNNNNNKTKQLFFNFFGITLIFYCKLGTIII